MCTYIQYTYSTLKHSLTQPRLLAHARYSPSIDPREGEKGRVVSKPVPKARMQALAVSACMMTKYRQLSCSAAVSFNRNH